MRNMIGTVERLASKTKCVALRLWRRIVKARRRRLRQESAFRRSLDQYRRSVGLPVVPDDDPILF